MKFGLFTVYACFLWLLAFVLIFNDYSIIKRCNSMRKDRDLSNYSVLKYGNNNLILYCVLMIISILSFILNNDFDFKLINVAIFSMALCEFITVILVSKLYYNDKEIIYEGEVYRIKSLKSAKKVKRFGKNHEVSTFDGKIVNVNQKVAEIIIELIEEKKEEKNTKKRKK